MSLLLALGPTGPFPQTPDPIRRAAMAAAIYTVASAFVPTPPFGERITVDKWFSPFSEPVRQKIGLATREQRADWLVQATFGEPVFESKWHQPWSEPVRFRRLTTAQLAPEYVSTFKVEIITVDKWFIGLSEPQRFKCGLAAYQQLAAVLGRAGPFTESVTEDRWHQPWSEPQRFLRGERPEAQQFLALHPRPIIDISWYEGLSEPRRFPRGLPSYEQQFFAYQPTPIISIGWFAGLSGPQRALLGLPAREQAPFFFQPTPIIDISWHRPFDEPRRFRRALPAFEQHYFETESIPVVSFGWFEALSEPQRFKRGLMASAQRYLFFHPFPIPHQIPPTDRPLFLRGSGGTVSTASYWRGRGNRTSSS